MKKAIKWLIIGIIVVSLLKRLFMLLLVVVIVLGLVKLVWR